MIDSQPPRDRALGNGNLGLVTASRGIDDDAARLVSPPGWGYSLHNHRELILACLDAADVGSILEIGAFEGDLTEDLLGWAAERGAGVETVDPVPPPKLLERAEAHPELVLHTRTSHEVLGDLDELPDAIVIDGDHNHYTLSEELRLIGEKAGDGPLPLLFFHDVCWPHERRDTYYAPERIPEDRRPEIGTNVGLAPGNPGTDPLGLPYPAAALREGGPNNGTVTAIEEFCERRGEVRFAVVPAFFGFGVLWELGAPYADAVAAVLDPFDRHPVLDRLEWNRAEHLVASNARAAMIGQLQERVRRQEELLREVLESRAFAMAERASRVYGRGTPAISRDAIVEVLRPDDGR
jgi:hypothetical protein